MDLHLDTLLHLPYATVETSSYIEGNVCLQTKLLNQGIACPKVVLQKLVVVW